MTTTGRWEYTGDVNLEHGGVFIDMSTWDDGYCSAVRVTDLDSGCGFTGAILIEHVVINGTDDPERIRKALECVGGSPFRGRRSRVVPAEEINQTIRLAIAEALLIYGYYEPDDAWYNYQSHHSETVQLEHDGPMLYDGWKADKRLRGGDLQGYVEAVHLRE